MHLCCLHNPFCICWYTVTKNTEVQLVIVKFFLSVREVNGRFSWVFISFITVSAVYRGEQCCTFPCVCILTYSSPHFNEPGIYLPAMSWEHSSQMEAVDLVRKIDVKRPLPGPRQTHMGTQTHKNTHACVHKHTVLCCLPFNKPWPGLCTCCTLSY